MTGRLFVLAGVFAGLAGCREETSLGSPRPESMSPGIALAGAEVTATVTGARFYVDPSVSYADGGGPDVDAGFRAFLGSAELPSVTRIDSETLEVVVPGTLPAGAYDLTVVDSRGERGTLAEAFAVVQCLTVTTDADEDDAGESAVPPHDGSGLSLREAIGVANEVQAGSLCIGFSEPMTIALGTSSLPAFSGPAAIELDGGGVVLDGAAVVTSAIGLDFASPGAVVTGLHIRGFTGSTGIGIRFAGADSAFVSGELSENRVGMWLDGANGRVEASTIRDHGYMGVRIQGPDSIVVGNRFTDIGSFAAAVAVEPGGDRASIHRNVFIRAVAGVYLQSVADVDIAHATFHDGAVAVFVDDGSGVTGTNIRNSIISDMSFAAISGDDVEIATLSYVTFDNNNGGPCTGCTTDGNTDNQDPRYVDPATDDLSLQPSSPCIDDGTDLGIDVNGAAQGLFNGTAPDRGALESP